MYNDKVNTKSKKRKKPSKVFQESRRRGLRAGADTVGLCALEISVGKAEGVSCVRMTERVFRVKKKRDEPNGSKQSGTACDTPLRQLAQGLYFYLKGVFRLWKNLLKTQEYSANTQ